jgi:4-hydroxy-tetrahydrodipicolinate reductase
MTINVIVNGAKGKMGCMAVPAIESAKSLTLVGQTDRGDNLADSIESCNADVVVDLTHPDCVLENVTTILNSTRHAVVGTTGLTESDLKVLHELAKQKNRCVCVCPNFAIGAVLLMKFAAEAANYFPDIEIIESHHNQKADAPSGTALKTADLIYEQNNMINASPSHETECITGARGGKYKNIPIHSVRLPGIIADQEVIMGGVGQTLSIKHHTISRESFMPGIILCAEQVMCRPSGLIYGLEKLL